MAPRAGFEPATIRLTVECSTAELPRNRRSRCSRMAAYNKAALACKAGNAPGHPGSTYRENLTKPAIFQGFSRLGAVDPWGQSGAGRRQMPWTDRESVSFTAETG